MASDVNNLFVPPGHFYSPIPSLEDIERDQSRLFATSNPELPGIDMRQVQQLALVESFREYYEEIPFTDTPGDDFRFGFNNPAYSYGDGVFLYFMLRSFRPRRLIEVGSGHSSCLVLDVNEKFLEGTLRLTFIEPYPELLRQLIKPGDEECIKIIPMRLQDVELSTFDELEAGDFLFIDSTHVSKSGSDVNRIIFEILPNLKPGVFVHFHDIFYPFEYPKVWALEGRAWNEAYLLRAFLQYNNSWEVILMNTYLWKFFEEQLADYFPLCLKNIGASIWLKKSV